MREDCYKGNPKPHHRLFSVDISDAHVTSSAQKSRWFSTVTIPIGKCRPSFQRLHKLRRNRCPSSRRSNVLTTLLALFCALYPQEVYALPGESHALIKGASLDTHRQQSLVATTVSNLVGNSHMDQSNPHSLPADATQPKTEVEATLHSGPHCFVADTDSVPIVIDTGANRFIVNNVDLLSDFESVKGGVKGVGGSSVSIEGKGTYSFPLAKTGVVDVISVEAVYVPSSPFILAPPQLIISELKTQGYQVNMAEHDESHFRFHYCPPSESTMRTMEVPIDRKGLFTYWSTPGYNAFFAEAASYNAEWTMYPGSSPHLIPDDDSITQGQMRESNRVGNGEMREQMRESMREPMNSSPHIIPAGELDFDEQLSPDSASPFEAEDPNVMAVKLKQHRLSVFHERFGHLSYSKLQLMARCGLIPKELANVPPPSL
eukprot:scaffold1887_cov73-Cylindrotheca_fusiformis.AAC.2